jgi:hypothetical protein
MPFQGKSEKGEIVHRGATTAKGKVKRVIFIQNDYLEVEQKKLDEE